MMRTDEERKAIEFIEKWKESEKGPFNTAWPFDVILSYINQLETGVRYWETKCFAEIDMEAFLERMRDVNKRLDDAIAEIDELRPAK